MRTGISQAISNFALINILSRTIIEQCEPGLPVAGVAAAAAAVVTAGVMVKPPAAGVAAGLANPNPPNPPGAVVAGVEVRAEAPVDAVVVVAVEAAAPNPPKAGGAAADVDGLKREK